MSRAANRESAAAMQRAALTPYAVWAVVFIVVPLFFIAYFATASLGNDGIAAGVSILAFFAGIIPAIRYDRRLKRSGGMTFTIVQAF